jgi:hypothetical protein
MIFKTIRNKVSLNHVNFKGFSTKRRIIVFESDDWGSIRMPSLGTFNKLKENGIKVNNSPYCKFDTLESNTDLELLFETLLKFKDFKGNHPKITANTVVANPDFQKIKSDKFQNYYYEPFTETLQRYPNRNKVYELYKKGIDSNVFIPQFHGREHVNIEFWFELLKNNNNFKLAFELGLWGLSNDVFPEIKKSIQAAFDSNNNKLLEDSICSGLNLFNKLFDFKSESFIANNFIWDASLNKILKENGVTYLQGMKYQFLPIIDYSQKRKILRHYTGEKNSNEQYYLVRNVSFEPSINNENFQKTISEISNSFFWNRPAIIGTHRINFMGELSENNRTSNLKQFDILLSSILKKWPEVEFMSTVELGNIIKFQNND